jgi:hypothetical protein
MMESQAATMPAKLALYKDGAKSLANNPENRFSVRLFLTAIASAFL